MEWNKNRVDLMDDWQLLRRYASTKSEAAFSELVHRHIHLVYSVCLRHLRNVQDAEDATQSVFLALSRKAQSLPEGTILPGWLYNAARLVSMKAARRDSRRRRREIIVASLRPEEQPAPSTPDVDVDRALASLKKQERLAVVLRYFAGQSFQQVAQQLGLTEAAARKRVWRAVEKMRSRLQPAGGSALSVAGMEVLLHSANSKAPIGLAADTLKAITSGVAATKYASLFKGTLMAMSKAKAAVAALAAIIVLSGGAVTAFKLTHPSPVQTVVIPSAAPAQPQGLSTNWSQFDRLYALSEGQYIKQVGPPMIPEREAFWEAAQRSAGMPVAPLRPGDCLTIEWRGNSARSNFGAVPRGKLALPIQVCASLKGWQLDSSIPLNLDFPGDWVMRSGATPEQIMRGLGPIVSARLGRAVHFETRTVPRPALVARGKYQFTPLPNHQNDGIIDFIGQAVSTDPPPYIQTASVQDLLMKLGMYLNKHVIDETEDAAQIQVKWNDHKSLVDMNVLLQHIAQQTSYEFKPETRPTEIWFMVEDQKALFPPHRADHDVGAGILAD